MNEQVIILIDKLKKTLDLFVRPDRYVFDKPVGGSGVWGTYTPTLTGVSNVGASTAYLCQYMRLGNTVTVSGRFDLDPTAAAATQLGISLPIASNFTSSIQCGGTASDTNSQVGAIIGDATNNRAELNAEPASASNRIWHFIFMYRII